MIKTEQLESIRKEDLMEKHNDAIETIWFLEKQLRDSIRDYDAVFENYHSASGDLEFLGSKCNQMEEELRYMQDFIKWMHLSGMYEEFRKNAREFQPEDGSFPYYTMEDAYETRGII